MTDDPTDPTRGPAPADAASGTASESPRTLLRAADLAAIAAAPAASASPRGPTAPPPAAGVAPPRILQAVHALLGAVPGLTVDAVVPADQGLSPLSMEVSVDGWSPSLHALAMEWSVRLPTPIGDAEPADVEAALRPLVAVQRRRAAEALALGHALPIDSDATPCAIAHMTVDRATIALLAELHDGLARALRALRTDVHRLHRGALDHRGGPMLADAGTSVHDEIGNHHLSRTVGIAGRTATTSDSPVAHLHDQLLVVHADAVPDTVAAAMTGRPVGDLVRLHDALDHRIVDHAETSDGTIVLRLAPDRIRIGDLAGYGRAGER